MQGASGRHSSQARAPRASRVPQQASQTVQTPDEIASRLASLTWCHRLWGVDEAQVWHVVERLDQMWAECYRLQRAHYEALLAEARGAPLSPEPR